MNTIRVFHSDVNAKSVRANIMALPVFHGKNTVVCDRTVFFPEDGGQPSDVGTIKKLSTGEVFNVVDAQDEDLQGDIYHFVDAPEGTFEVGEEVELTLDWAWRFRNMQRHSGEHILSGAIYKVFGGKNKGSFHMGENYITADFDTDGRKITPEMLRAAEDLANDIIYRDVPITVHWFDGAEEASKMPVRKEVTVDGKVSIVVVGDPADPDDCVACCGTHPTTSGQIGLIKIYKAESNKGMTRLYFDCGSAALEQVRKEMDVMTEITNKYSASPDTVLDKIAKQEAKDSALRQEHAALVNYVKDIEAARIAGVINSTEGTFFHEKSSLMDAGELLKVGFSAVSAAEKDNFLLVIEHEPSHTALLLTKGDYDAGALVKENAKNFGGKGGGRPDNARAMFPDAASLNSFLEAIRG